MLSESLLIKKTKEKIEEIEKFVKETKEALKNGIGNVEIWDYTKENNK